MIANECTVSTSINNIDNLYQNTIYKRYYSIRRNMKKINLFWIWGRGLEEESNVTKSHSNINTCKINTYPSRNTHDTGNHFQVILIK
ncbi:hypothetical protein JHK85_047843 [Glycine max]|uniref:Uncharacterized protein n=1 Tax=Glycine max TaxID=3847 RepID=K7MLF6_SOYBN|nr:hypothetical protein JHK85_047843 [Glycine max]KAH1118253.1 hypothetical protein GYH30_047133 [Glycine max]